MLESAGMPLPVSEVERKLTHTRRIRYEGYKRSDGLWDIEAHLLDTKNHDYHLKTGVRRAGQPIHDMWLRVTIDRSFTIHDALAAMDAVPYPGGCEKIPPAYRKLIGLNLMRGFRKRVWELLGNVKGCTHLTEMLNGVPTPRGFPAMSVDEALDAAKKLGGKVWVVKAQIHAGGRGKGGGVKVAKSLDEVRARASEILGMQLITHQTAPEGQKVRRLLIEEGADIRKELYVGMVVDRGSQKVVLMASSEGGMDIEEVAAKTPEKIRRVYIDPVQGLTDADADEIALGIGIPQSALAQGRTVFKGLFKCFDATDASLAEVNPLILTGDNRVVALDAKFNFDDNALFRHPQIQALRDLDEEDPLEIEASKYDLNYISLDGEIACMVNGAGLAMATMDTIKLYGGSPANRSEEHTSELQS